MYQNLKICINSSINIEGINACNTIVEPKKDKKNPAE